MRGWERCSNALVISTWGVLLATWCLSPCDACRNMTANILKRQSQRLRARSRQLDDVYGVGREQGDRRIFLALQRGRVVQRGLSNDAGDREIAALRPRKVLLAGARTVRDTHLRAGNLVGVLDFR